ncbi:MAG: hypothetical protein Hals2KO_06630 [Halioglobus sp.]
MSLPGGNPRIPEGINASEENPLLEFAWLAGALLLGLAALVLVLSVSARWLAPFIPFSWEQRASAAVDVFLESEDVQNDNADASAALGELSAALLQSSLRLPVAGRPAAEVVPPQAFRFHLLSNPQPNAFATLGANVLVTEGLLGHVRSENGLAMVIAHEIAHVQLRHPVESLGRGVVLQLVFSVITGSTDNTALGGALASGGLLTLLSFSREMELAADRRALALLESHYGHLGGADEFFESMDVAENSAQWLEFVSTHPATERRLALIHQAMAADTVQQPLRELPAALHSVAAAQACTAEVALDAAAHSSISACPAGAGNLSGP